MSTSKELRNLNNSIMNEIYKTDRLTCSDSDEESNDEKQEVSDHQTNEGEEVSDPETSEGEEISLKRNSNGRKKNEKNKMDMDIDEEKEKEDNNDQKKITKDTKRMKLLTIEKNILFSNSNVECIEKFKRFFLFKFFCAMKTSKAWKKHTQGVERWKESVQIKEEMKKLKGKMAKFIGSVYAEKPQDIDPQKNCTDRKVHEYLARTTTAYKIKSEIMKGATQCSISNDQITKGNAYHVTITIEDKVNSKDETIEFVTQQFWRDFFTKWVILLVQSKFMKQNAIEQTKESKNIFDKIKIISTEDSIKKTFTDFKEPFVYFYQLFNKEIQEELRNTFSVFWFKKNDE